jgi:osmotically-inducible protein OsmY
MTTDAQLEADVRAELAWEAEAIEPRQLVVSADAGTVALRGAVSCIRQRHALVAAAKRVLGTCAVDDGLTIELPGGTTARELVEIAESARDALRRNALTHAARVGITIDGTVATLDGTVRSWAERDAVLLIVSATPGVARLDDRIAVTG